MGSTNTKLPELSGRQRLAAAGLTQAEIADLAEVSQQAVSQWLSRQKTPGRKAAGLLWDKLKIPPPSWDLPDAASATPEPMKAAPPLAKGERARRPATRRTTPAPKHRAAS